MVIKIIIRLLAAICLVVLAVSLWGNVNPELTIYRVVSPNLPAGFEGYRIALLSDLHDAQLGENNEKILNLLREAQPEIIVMTGDMIDARRPDTTIAPELAKEAVQIAPCYYVPGNHEASLPDYLYEELKDNLQLAGVTVLQNQTLQLTRNGDQITLLGIRDPGFALKTPKGWRSRKIELETKLNMTLSRLLPAREDYTVMLIHQPPLPEYCQEQGIDLALSGHFHGGQIRIPFIGGVARTRKAFFTRKDSGLLTSGDASLIISRGLGNSSFPLRVNNRPEVVLVELRPE